MSLSPWAWCCVLTSVARTKENMNISNFDAIEFMATKYWKLEYIRCPTFYNNKSLAQFHQIKILLP